MVVGIKYGFLRVVRDAFPRGSTYSTAVGIELEFHRFRATFVCFSEVEHLGRGGREACWITIRDVSDDDKILGESITCRLYFDGCITVPRIILGCDCRGAWCRSGVVGHGEEKVARFRGSRNSDSGDALESGALVGAVNVNPGRPSTLRDRIRAGLHLGTCKTGCISGAWSAHNSSRTSIGDAGTGGSRHREKEKPEEREKAKGKEGRAVS